MTILCSLAHLIIHKIVNTRLSYIIHISTVSPDRLTLMPPNPSADRVQPASVCHLFDAKFVHHFVLHHVSHITPGEVLFKPIHFRHPIPQVDDASLASSTWPTSSLHKPLNLPDKLVLLWEVWRQHLPAHYSAITKLIGYIISISFIAAIK